MGLHFSKVAVSFTVKVNRNQLQQHLPASAHVVGEELGSLIYDYAVANKLGYFPALDFFREQALIDKDLLDAVDNISWLVCNLVREEVRTHLRPVFSNLRFEAIQALSFTMPTVRPGQVNAKDRLCRHFTPDQVKVSLLATSIRKQEDPQQAIKMTRHQIMRWLENHFAELEISSVRYIDEN